MPLPGDPDTYNEIVIQARRDALAGDDGLTAQALQDLREEFADMILEINQDVEAGRITEARAERLRDSINDAMRRFANRAPVILENARDEAIRASVTAHEDATRRLVAQSQASVEVGERFAQVPDDVVEMAMRRRALGASTTFQTLINRNVQEAAGSIDRAITSALARGEANQELTKRIAGHLARNDEELLDVLRRRGKAGRDLAESVAGLDLTDDELQRSKRLLYDARRIAVTEISNHYDEADAVSMARSPVVDLIQWNTSAQHGGLDSSPDRCDYLEQANPHGYGVGLYHPETVPARPHPHCQCPKTAVTHRPENYGKTRDVPPKPEIDEDRMGEVLKRLEREEGRTVTDNYIQNEANGVQRMVDAIYENPR